MVTGRFLVFFSVVRYWYVVVSLRDHTPDWDVFLPRLRYSTFTLASTPRELQRTPQTHKMGQTE